MDGCTPVNRSESGNGTNRLRYLSLEIYIRISFLTSNDLTEQISPLSRCKQMDPEIKLWREVECFTRDHRLVGRTPPDVGAADPNSVIDILTVRDEKTRH